MLLVDEYDVPLQNAYVEGYYEEAIKFFKTFYGITFKVSWSIFTSIDSSFNNLSIFDLPVLPARVCFAFNLAKFLHDGAVSLLNAWVLYVKHYEDFMYNVG